MVALQSIFQAAVSTHFEVNISIQSNEITPCEGNMNTARYGSTMFDDCNKDFNRVTVIMINFI